MQEDTFPAAEKILSDIENVVKKDSSLKSFEIVPAEDNENKSPVFHQEACLGLASWCVQPLYCYVYRRLLDLRRNKHRREELSTVARWLFGALLLNPDVTTFWNMRRELVRNHKLNPCEELSFTRLVLFHKPKCFEAFAYRRWLLSHVLDVKDDCDPAPAESPLCTEIEIAKTSADRYANNYYAWSHRRHVLALREARNITHPSLESEWKSSLAWFQRHVSDYSGLAYRRFLLKKCMFESRPPSDPENFSKDTADRKEYLQRRDSVFSYVASGINDLSLVDELQQLLRRGVTSDALNLMHGGSCRSPSETEERACFHALSYWVEECQVNENSIELYNDHEALWYHRRFLAYLLLRSIASYKKYSQYRDELVDARTCAIPSANDDVDEKNAPVDDETLSRSLLVVAFRNRTREIVELAKKRNDHEATVVKRFVQFLNSIGLEI